MKKTLLIAFALITAGKLIAQPVMVKDIFPGSKGSAPAEYATVGGKLYFKVVDTLNTYGSSFLYESNGTDAGTKKLMHLGNASHFAAFNNKLLYIDDTTGGTNWEPYITDLTKAGTFKLKEIFPGANIGSSAACEAVIGNTAFLYGSDSQTTGHYGYWKTDGTAAGTTLMFYTDKVRTIVFKNKVYFWGRYNNVAGLYSFDATSTQPTLVKKHINPAYPDFALAIGANSFYYVANDSTHGFEPWVSDGSTAGTNMIKDVNPGITKSCDDGGSSNFTSMALMNNKMYFNPVNAANGRELWETDGTDAGTKIAIDMTPGTSSTNLRYLISTGNKLYFNLKSSGYNVLWSSDGTTAAVLKDKNNSTVTFNNNAWVLNNKIFFIGTPINSQDVGDEPFITDGTSAGTELLKNIDTTAYNGGINAQSNGLPFVIGNTIYFGANDKIHGNELWKYTDGVPTAISNVTVSASYLSLYPNPASNLLNIDTKEAVKNIEIYNIAGILQKSVPYASQIDVSDLATGLYIIKAYTNNGLSVQKFAKQ